MSWSVAICMMAITAIACNNGSSSTLQGPDGGSDAAKGPSGCAPAAVQQSDVDCSRVGRIALAGMEQDLGNGSKLAVRLESRDGEPLDAETYGQCVHLLDPTNCSELSADVRVEARPADGALTALLVAPGTSAESAARAQATVEALLAARPASERIALFRWGKSVSQVSDFSRDRALAMRLSKRGLVESAEPALQPAEAVAAIRDQVAQLSRATFAGVRTIVVIAPELMLDAQTPRVPDPAEVVVLWAVANGAAIDRPDIVALSDSPAITASALSEAISAHVNAGLVQFAWCGSGSAHKALLQPHRSPAERIVDVPKALPEEAHMQCTLDGLSQPRAYPQRIDFVFSDEAQRTAYHERLDTKSKEEFDVMVRLWEDGALAPAKAKLRGMSSLNCARKSYALDFPGSLPRRLMPRSATDEFFLISMCEDDRYMGMRMAFTYLTRLNIFPLEFRFIELTIDNAHQGLYMLIEKPKDEILHDSSRVRGIVRRNADLENEAPESKYGFEGEQQALDGYTAFMSAVERAPADALLETLETHMDIDGYLRWIALMTLFGNGDYSDEAYFVSTESTDSSLGPVDFYSVFGWDPENLFQACHHNGQYAFVDPNGLLSCTEAQLDHTIFANSEVYARYVDVLESVLDAVTQQEFDALADETYNLLDGYFIKDDLRAAMVEILLANPDAATYEGIMWDVNERRKDMKAGLMDNQARLRAAIEAWRAQ